MERNNGKVRERHNFRQKKRKFLRDKLDYDKEVAYKWKHLGNKRGRNLPNNASHRDVATPGD